MGDFGGKWGMVGHLYVEAGHKLGDPSRSIRAVWCPCDKHTRITGNGSRGVQYGFQWEAL